MQNFHPLPLKSLLEMLMLLSLLFCMCVKNCISMTLPYWHTFVCKSCLTFDLINILKWLLFYYTGCGGDLSGPTGSFNSPGYPMKYPNNRECIWHVNTSPGSSVQITILEFSIENHITCNYDVLEVSSGVSGQKY